MSKLIKPLSAKQIENAKPTDTPYKLFDGFGLYLLINPKGSKLWYFRYTRPNVKKQTTIALGRYPTLSLLEARRLREKYLNNIAHGVDPVEERRETERAAILQELSTVKAVYLKWIEVKKSQVEAKTVHLIEIMAKNHILNHFGKLKIKDLTIPFILNELEYLANSGRYATRIKVAKKLRELTTFATIQGIIPYNPLSDIIKALPSHDEQPHLTIKPDELPDFLNVLINSNEYPVYKILVLWQLLTMVRPVEAVNAEWSEIDFENEVWRIPKHKMKGSKKNRNEHAVPLSKQAIQLLKEVYAFTGRSQFVFEGRHESSRSSVNRFAVNTIIRIGYRDRLDAHGLRSIASTYLNDIGVDGDVIEACLAHKVGGSVRNAYNRSTFFERRKPVMQQWADFVEQCAGGNLFIGLMAPKKNKSYQRKNIIKGE